MPVTVRAPAPILREDDLYEVFHSAEKPASAWRVGTEAEKFAVHITSGRPLAYEGPLGVEGIFDHLAAHHGWAPVREYDGGPVIALTRVEESITLEPGAQIELSGAPHTSLHETKLAFERHMRELASLPPAFDLAWLGVGFHPFATQADLPWVPKLRYGIMREYLPTRGDMALDMMRRTATVQANVDYSSEADAMRKLRVASRLTPIVAGMFANSPFEEGRRSRDLSHRTRVWLHMDPDRSGLLAFQWKENATYQDYVSWALDVPMFLVKRGAKVLHNTGQTFRSFLADGFEGERATQGDWETHLGTLFPEVRLKRTIELRSADGQNGPLTVALPALWKGLLYDAVALDAADTLTRALTFEEACAARALVPEQGLRAPFAGRPLAEWAEEVFEIARAGLDRIGVRNERGETEAQLLAPLGELVHRHRSPAEVLLEAAAGAPDFRTGVLSAAAV